MGRKLQNSVDEISNSIDIPQRNKKRDTIFFTTKYSKNIFLIFWKLYYDYKLLLMKYILLYLENNNTISYGFVKIIMYKIIGKDFNRIEVLYYESS